MNRADCKALRSAALQLLDWARVSRESQCGDKGDWDNGCGQAAAAKALHDKHIRTAKRLRAIANAEQAKLPKQVHQRRGAQP